jgi:hypothetical protein
VGLALAGCGKAGSSLLVGQSTISSATSTASVADSPPAPSPAETKTVLEMVLQDKGADWREFHAADYGIPHYQMSSMPAWESNPNAKWSDYAEDFSQYAAFVIDHEGPNLLASTAQMADSYAMCPKYASLSREQKINFWVVFVSEVTRYESGFDPTSRYFESTFGYKDSVTGENVYSEGLLQLSYQDGSSYKKECGVVFDWPSDKLLSRTDPKKTILNPLRNLYCGIRIMDSTMRSKKKLLFDSGNYWATLKPGGSYGKVTTILSHLAKIPFCR